MHHSDIQQRLLVLFPRSGGRHSFLTVMLLEIIVSLLLFVFEKTTALLGRLLLLCQGRIRLVRVHNFGHHVEFTRINQQGSSIEKKLLCVGRRKLELEKVDDDQNCSHFNGTSPNHKTQRALPFKMNSAALSSFNVCGVGCSLTKSCALRYGSC